ncbi:hypothetical protein Bca52824_030294 [Brassica carinata]|uniref:Uncharacterized protein n=1 Tax=Brassica carinata TaxID=52824 RepID=A0A8X7S5W4_BRACI|nr:hypothetical protein Bca52824_030294 [Brassica carinata]
MEEERTKVLIAIEKQRVAEKEAETKKIMAISEAEKNANVRKILMQQKLTEKDIPRREADIENQMYLDRQKSLADADYYRCHFQNSKLLAVILTVSSIAETDTNGYHRPYSNRFITG